MEVGAEEARKKVQCELHARHVVGKTGNLWFYGMSMYIDMQEMMIATIVIYRIPSPVLTTLVDLWGGVWGR